jgi:hypothetical protein
MMSELKNKLKTKERQCKYILTLRNFDVSRKHINYLKY